MALARFDRDVLCQAGVKYVIVLEGINDIGTLHDPNRPNDNITAEDLEQGLSQLVARAHEHGVKVFGGTLTPYKGADYFTERGERIREVVNRWILTSGVFDGTIDFDKATRDPANPLMLAPQYDNGDHLHPRDTGFRRVHLAPREKRNIEFTLAERDLSSVDETGQRRVVPGEVKVWIGGGQPITHPRLEQPSGAETSFKLTRTTTLPD